MPARRPLVGLMAVLLATGGSLALVAATPSGAAGGDTFTVTTTADEPDADLGDGTCATAADECSLRAAFDEAHADHEDGVTITVNVPAGTYVLSEELSTYQINVAIHGAGAGSTIVTVDTVQNPLVRQMDIGSDGEVDVTLTDMTFTGGFEGDHGGAIRFEGGSLALQRMEFTDNLVRGSGGAVAALDSDLTVDDSTFESNGASQEGGAIYADGGSDVAIQNSTFTDNNAGFGGALWFGAFDDEFDGASADLNQVTIAGNHATGLQGDPAGAAIGVGVNGDVTVTASIIENSSQGGGILPVAVGDPIDNCTVLDGGVLASGGENVIDDESCTADESDKVGVSAGVAALADNGGPTRTMALTATSPATDEAVDECDLTVDQRGVARPQDGNNDGTTACDAGAFELESVEEGPPAALPVEAPAPFTG